MPTIRPSSDLGSKYNEISEFCHTSKEPVYITKNGQDDLAVMSVETFEHLIEKSKLFSLLAKGMDDVKSGRIKPYQDVFRNLEKGLVDEIRDSDH